MHADEEAGDSAPDISVAVVDSETPGNVGTIARAMKNFGLSDLLLVDPPPLDPDGEAYGLAGHAREDVLPNATEITFEKLAREYHTIACTATTNEDATEHVRYPAVEPAALVDELRGVDSQVALVFGRESVGLSNEELTELDRICSIPASASYPVLNLGQAATITLYELRSLTVIDTQHPETIHRRADEAEIERLHDQFGEFIEAVGHPEHKQEKTSLLFRRLLGRADPTPREVRTLVGLFRRGSERPEQEAEDSSAD
jgi:TrmH family RNA methyltransferase